MKQLLTTLTLLFSFGQITFGQITFNNERIVWTDFEWADPASKDVMLITSKLDTLDYLFRWQLDTGSPYTYLEGGTFKKFTNKFPYLSEMIKRIDTFIMAIGIKYLHHHSNLTNLFYQPQF